MLKKFLFPLFISFISVTKLLAQDTTAKITAKTFSADTTVVNAISQYNKIYVVVTVISIILLGLFFYLFRLDKKISQLEKKRM